MLLDTTSIQNAYVIIVVLCALLCVCHGFPIGECDIRRPCHGFFFTCEDGICVCKGIVNRNVCLQPPTPRPTFKIPSQKERDELLNKITSEIKEKKKQNNIRIPGSVAAPVIVGVVCCLIRKSGICCGSSRRNPSRNSNDTPQVIPANSTVGVQNSHGPFSDLYPPIPMPWHNGTPTSNPPNTGKPPRY